MVQQQIKSQSERRENTGTSETSEEGRKKRSPQPGSLFLWFSILLSDSQHQSRRESALIAKQAEQSLSRSVSMLVAVIISVNAMHDKSQP